MKRWLASLAVLATGCTGSDGQPWGRFELTAATAFDASGRLEGDQLKTSKDYRVQLDTLTLQLGAVRAVVVPSADAAGFDPANPPAGYTLCHNGHCHNDAGELVDYATISAQVSQGASGGQTLTLSLGDEVDVLADEPLATVACSQDCALERGVLASVELDVVAARLEGHAWDSREPARLADEGVAFAGTVPVAVTYTAILSHEIGPEGPLNVNVHADLEVQAAILDALDFEGLAGKAATLELSTAVGLAEALTANLKHDAVFDAHLTTEFNR